MSSVVQPGVDALCDSDFAVLRGKRVGLLSNPSGVDSRLRSTQQILWQSSNVNLVVLFAPEHGVAASAQDGTAINESRDRCSGLPIYSLYGKQFRPTQEMMAAVDAIVCDLQDVGARFYTVAWAPSHVLEAAGEQGIDVMILDRPNPLGGLHLDGPLLQDNLESLVGRSPVPILHGLSLGELMLMFNSLWNPHPCTLTLVACLGWRRNMSWKATGLIWVPPSPNMPFLSTVAHYPGACLVEGSNLSEGRGTALPFEVVGAPWIDSYGLADQLNRQEMPGLRFCPHEFVPVTSKYVGQICFGVQAHITDGRQFKPVETWLAVIQTIRRDYPDHFAWVATHFDRLIGTHGVRSQIDAGVEVAEIVRNWQNELRSFDDQRRPFLRY